MKANSDEGTTFDFGGGRFELTAHGVHYIGKDKDGQDKPPQWICSPLRVSAKTRDPQGNAWGRLLEWQDDDGNPHQWAMPMELLEGDGAEVRKELARLGLHIAPSQTARNLLAAYINRWPVVNRAVCSDRLGWHGGAYLLPDRTIQNGGEAIVYQNSHGLEATFAQAGTGDAWRANVAALAVGNSRLMFAISLALAGPLAGLVGEGSGGFHLRGASSIGKSTALQVAASVWGNPASHVRLWRSTTNGLEGLAALHNDGLLILDEIGQIDPHAAGDAAYLLANGQGKARANRHGLARPPQRWRLLFLSAGEESLANLMARAGQRATAGQEIRLADIEADAGAGLGLFEDLHGQGTPAAFAATIKDACGQYHGHAGLEWLAYLVATLADAPTQARACMDAFLAQAQPPQDSGQLSRVAARFALATAAGELASRAGITGWAEGKATLAALECYFTWLHNFGDGNREERAILQQAMAFLETHGTSRFEDIRTDGEPRILNRAGYYRTGPDGEREFLMLRATFQTEICKGYDEKTVKRALVDAGLLQPGKDGKPTQNIRLPGLGPSRAYVFRYLGDARA